MDEAESGGDQAKDQGGETLVSVVVTNRRLRMMTISASVKTLVQMVSAPGLLPPCRKLWLERSLDQLLSHQ